MAVAFSIFPSPSHRLPGANVECPTSGILNATISDLCRWSPCYHVWEKKPICMHSNTRNIYGTEVCAGNATDHTVHRSSVKRMAKRISYICRRGVRKQQLQEKVMNSSASGRTPTLIPVWNEDHPTSEPEYFCVRGSPWSMATWRHSCPRYRSRCHWSDRRSIECCRRFRWQW